MPCAGMLAERFDKLDNLVQTLHQVTLSSANGDAAADRSSSPGRGKGGFNASSRPATPPRVASVTAVQKSPRAKVQGAALLGSVSQRT